MKNLWRAMMFFKTFAVVVRIHDYFQEKNLKESNRQENKLLLPWKIITCTKMGHVFVDSLRSLKTQSLDGHSTWRLTPRPFRDRSITPYLAI